MESLSNSAAGGSPPAKDLVNESPIDGSAPTSVRLDQGNGAGLLADNAVVVPHANSSPAAMAKAIGTDSSQHAMAAPIAPRQPPTKSTSSSDRKAVPKEHTAAIALAVAAVAGKEAPPDPNELKKPALSRLLPRPPTMPAPPPGSSGDSTSEDSSTALFNEDDSDEESEEEEAEENYTERLHEMAAHRGYRQELMDVSGERPGSSVQQ